MIIKKIIKEGDEVVVFILGQEDIKKLKSLLTNGTQAQIQFDIANQEKDELLVDPLKGSQNNTRKAIIELIQKFKTSPFTTNDFSDIRRKYYVPNLYEALKKLEKKELASIQGLSHRLKVYQFSEKLCRHFGN